MCYKEELQKKNKEKLQKRFDDENIPFFIQKFFLSLYSKAGAINYWVVIRDLLIWLMKEKIINKTYLSDIEPNDFYKIDPVDITLYLQSKEESMAKSTIKMRKNVISSFWNYLIYSSECPVEKNIIKAVKYRSCSVNKNLVEKVPTEEQLKEMEEKLSKKNDEFLRNRNLAIFLLLKGSGIRETELVGLDLDDLFLNEDIPYIRIIGKGMYHENESRDVKITKSAADSVKEWLEIRNEFEELQDVQAVFVTKKGRRILESEIRSLFKNNSNGVTPHMIRHWYATIMQSKGRGLFAQQQLGHSSLSTTTNNYIDASYGMKDVLESM